MITEQIEELLQEKFAEPEFADCFVVEVKLEGKKGLEVYVDSDSGITLEKCQRISRFLESHLDTNGWLGEDYSLDVSSPGISRPLKFARQYHRNIGRTLEVQLSAGESKTGVLKTVNPESIILEEEIKWKEGKKNMKGTVQTVISFEHIAKATVKLSF